MFFKNKLINVIFGIVITILIYISATFVILILAKSYSTPSRPIIQTTKDIKTVKYADGSIDLKYTATFEIIPDEITISLTRAYFNLDTNEVYLLPHQMIHVTKGHQEHSFINPLPKNMQPGDYYYVRSFDFTPPLGMISKTFDYDPIEFRVCKEKGECLHTPDNGHVHGVNK